MIRNFEPMQPQELPDNILKEINAEFEAASEVRKLRIQMDMLMRSGQLEAALNIGKQVEDLRSHVILEYMRMAENNEVAFNGVVSQLGGKEQDETMTAVIMLFMCADIIDACVMDMDKLLETLDGGYRFTTFDDIRDLSTMAKRKLAYLRERAEWLNTEEWGDVTDNMYKVMFNKARSLMKKYYPEQDGKGFLK